MAGPARITLRETGGCNVCNPALRKAVAEGLDVQFELEGKNCRHCNSPGRQRALARMIDTVGEPLLKRLGISGTARTLSAAPGHGERYLLEPLCALFQTFSLFGTYGEDNLQCDVRDLSRFEPGSFDLFETSLVLDYVPEISIAIENLARVLARPSAFFIIIHEKRLLPGSDAPRVSRTRNRASGLPGYYPEDYERQQITVGRKWFDAEWRKHGFDVQQVIWRDASIAESFTWWVGHR